MQRASRQPVQGLQPAQTEVEIRVPTNRQELESIVMLRSELRDQLGSITRLRQELTNQIAQANAVNDAASVRDLQGRVRNLEARSRTIEQQILRADEAMSAGIARGVATPETRVTVAAPPPPPRIIQVGTGGADRELLASTILGMSLLFTFLGIMIHRRAWRRAEKKFAAAGPGDTAQMRQLQQAVDVIAVEVERIAEGQRFVSRLLSERLEGVAPEGRERVLVPKGADAERGSGR